MEDKALAWMNNYNTINTRNGAKSAYNSFSEYLENMDIGIDEFIESLKVSEDEKYIKLNQYQKSLVTMPASIKKNYAFIKSYLRVCYGIKLDNDDQKQYIKFKPIQKINREPLLKNVIKILCQNANRLHKAFYLIQASSGMRASESLNLKKEDFDFNSDPIKITIPASLTKTQTERITFISKEAKSSLDKIGSEYFKPKNLNMIEQYFYKLRKICELTDRYPNTPNYKTNIHSFRAFFRTEAGKLNQDFGESILGHQGYLRQYIRLTDDDLRAYYTKLEPKLKIF